MPAGDRLRRSGRASTSASPTSPTGTIASHRDEVTYVSLGDGTTSEGEFWESLNAACLSRAARPLPRRGQRLRDLRPGRSADAGGDISKLVASFPGLFVRSIDGTDFVASYRTMRDAIAHARERRGRRSSTPA